MNIRTETIQIPSNDPWAVELRSKKMIGGRASYGLMTSLGLDVTVQWQIQTIDLLGEHVRVTLQQVPFDLDSVESVEIETDVQMMKRNLIWQTPPTARILEGGLEHMFGSMTSAKDSRRSEFIAGLGRLNFWLNAMDQAKDWGRGEPTAPNSA